MMDLVEYFASELAIYYYYCEMLPLFYYSCRNALLTVILACVCVTGIREVFVIVMFNGHWSSLVALF